MTIKATELKTGQRVRLDSGLGTRDAMVVSHVFGRFGHHVELITDEGERETISGEETHKGIGWAVLAPTPKLYAQQIGELIRDGRKVYYATVRGVHVEHANRAEVEAWLWAEGYGDGKAQA